MKPRVYVQESFVGHEFREKEMIFLEQDIGGTL